MDIFWLVIVFMPILTSYVIAYLIEKSVMRSRKRASLNYSLLK